MIDSAIYDRIYAGIARSVVYREAIAMLDLPDWVVPLSCVNRSELQRIADELSVGPGGGEGHANAHALRLCAGDHN